MKRVTRLEVGQVPSAPQVFRFYDETGKALNLEGYTSFDVELLGSDNEKVDVSDAQLGLNRATEGVLTLVWPRRSNVFSKVGEYRLRFALNNSLSGSKDYSETHEIRVTHFGRNDK